MTRSFKLEFGGFRAQGVPAIILSLAGLTAAAGAVRLLNANASMLPETLREAKGFVEALRGDSPKRLNS